jgi:hypothetical protein
MKKFVIFALIAAMAAGVAFAQTADGISVNAWGRGVFVPLQSYSAWQEGGDTAPDKAGDDIGSVAFAGSGAAWGGAVRTGFNVNGNAEFIGFQIQIKEAGWDGRINDFSNSNDCLNIWAKPFGSDILKLMIGSYEVDNLRGKVGTDTGFENFVVGGIPEDAIFQRFNARDYNTAAIITSEPMEGLFIGIEIPGQYNSGVGLGAKNAGEWSNKDGGKTPFLQDAYRFLTIGFGYVIPDIGHLRAQYIGGWFGTLDPEAIGKDAAKYKLVGDIFDPAEVDINDGKTGWTGGDPARIEVAFALTAVDNLTVDLGLKFWLPIEVSKDIYDSSATIVLPKGSKFSNGIDLGLGANYRMDAFAVAASVTAKFGAYKRFGDDDKYKASEGMSLGINVIPTYDLDAFTIGASIGLRTQGETKVDGEGAKDNTSQFGFGGFVKKDLGSGHIKAGLAYTTAKKTNDKADGSGIFTIPIIMEYAFF